MGGGVGVRALCVLDGEAQGVPDGTGPNLVVADESRKDGQSRGVGGSPTVGTQRVRSQVENRPGVGVPASTAEAGGVHLVEPAGPLLQRQHVAVGPALHGRVGGDGVGTGIGLAGFGEHDGQLRLGRRHDDVRQPVARVGTEVGMEMHVRADGSDVGARAIVDRVGGNVAVPGVVGREDRTRSGSRAAAGWSPGRRIGVASCPRPGAAGPRPLRAAAPPAGANAVEVARTGLEAAMDEARGPSRAPNRLATSLRGPQSPPAKLRARDAAAVAPCHEHRGGALRLRPQLERGPGGCRRRRRHQQPREQRCAELHRWSDSAALKRTIGSMGVGSTPSSTAR
jgi:hypothetical protein